MDVQSARELRLQLDRGPRPPPPPPPPPLPPPLHPRVHDVIHCDAGTRPASLWANGWHGWLSSKAYTSAMRLLKCLELINVYGHYGTTSDLQIKSALSTLGYSEGEIDDMISSAMSLRSQQYDTPESRREAMSAAVEAAIENRRETEIQKKDEEVGQLKVQLATALADAEASSREASKRAREQGQSKECVICMHESRSHILIPCGHMCVCSSCAEGLKKARSRDCPICRKKIRQIVQVFE